MHPTRKLMVLAINELLDQGKISLTSSGEDGVIHCKLAGKPSSITYREISFDELSIVVWWDYEFAGRWPSQQNVKEYMRKGRPGGTLVGWLERRTGPYVMGGKNNTLLCDVMRRDLRALLKEIPVPTANGFLPYGRMFC